MVRFISAGVLCSIVSAALVPLSAAAQDSDPPALWHMALAQTSAHRQAPLTWSFAANLSSLNGNAAVAGI